MSNSEYTDNLRKIKSLLVVTSLQKRKDIKAATFVRDFDGILHWEPFDNLMIDVDVWEYIRSKKYDPKTVFCHPMLLLANPTTSLYYRGLCGLSIKAAESYIGAIKSLEEGNLRARLSEKKALTMTRTYNLFICSIIKNSTGWSLENGYRTIIATMGISLDGTMRNKVGEIAEERIRILVLEWLIENNLLLEPLTIEQVRQEIPRRCTLRNNVVMQFSSEPDISFADEEDTILAIVEIKGGIDPAGALERYGAATKSFQHAIRVSPRCKNIYLGAVFTPELNKRISEDRLVERTFNIIDVLERPEIRENFFNEIFHHTLRLI